MDSNEVKKRKRILCLLAFLLFVSILAALLFGAVPVSLSELIASFTSNGSNKTTIILYHVRTPRVFAGVLSGAALAVAGMIIQTVLNNSLAGPNIIGVNAGAGFFVVLTAAIFPSSYYMTPFSAFVGALLAMFTVYFIAKKARASKITLILSGVAVNSLLNAATDAIQTINPDVALNNLEFKIGGLSSVDPIVLKIAAIGIAVGLLIIYAIQTELEILTLGEDTASSLGLQVNKYRFLSLTVAAILCGAAVSFCGLLGFVGLIVPHIARFLVGSEIKYLLPASMFLGATFVVLCDLIARCLFRPFELPVGIMMSFIGAPFFLYLLLSKKRGVRRD